MCEKPHKKSRSGGKFPKKLVIDRGCAVRHIALMDLAHFMKEVAMCDREVAEASGVERSAISRIRRKKILPGATNLLRLDRWAAALALRRRVPVSKRLDWEYVLARGKG